MKDIGISVSSLKRASKENTNYKDYRWLLVDKNSTEDPILPPTVKSILQKRDVIAMLNIDKTKIIHVYPSQKDASIARKHASMAAINKAIRNKTESSGHYWMYFDDCSKELKDEYLKISPIPEKPANHNSVKVQQIHPETNQIIRTFNTVNDAMNSCKMARRTLYKVTKNNTTYKNYKWKLIQSE